MEGNPSELLKLRRFEDSIDLVIWDLQLNVAEVVGKYHISEGDADFLFGQMRAACGKGYQLGFKEPIHGQFLLDHGYGVLTSKPMPEINSDTQNTQS